MPAARTPIPQRSFVPTITWLLSTTNARRAVRPSRRADRILLIVNLSKSDPSNRPETGGSALDFHPPGDGRARPPFQSGTRLSSTPVRRQYGPPPMKIFQRGVGGDD